MSDDLAGTDDATRLAPDANRPSAASRPASDRAVRESRPTSSTGWLSSSGAIDHGRFQPGTLLGERYRIIQRLGKGGMGEVYRADDIKLGQPVALKFLPPGVDGDPARLTQLHTEVRMARQVSHPNVCRVYDIDEIEGSTFLSMEYVDGEDLASLLRRVGRFPEDRALEIARQICAGLAAAHERHVVHRDLKPANIMLDGTGKVRLTDFGLAGIAGESIRAGTPAYMAPEQLAGGEVTPRSDIYSLGLVLYEIFTGQRALEGKNLAELIHKREHSGIQPPTAIVKTLDPKIELAILRCLKPQIDERPATALAVAAALPGGDPLAAALAAGETPSPDLVAAAGQTDALHPAIGFTIVAAVLVGLLICAAAGDRYLLYARVPMQRSLDSLQDRARDLMVSLGYPTAGIDSFRGLSVNSDVVSHISRSSNAPDRWDALNRRTSPVMLFWHRSSPNPLVAASSNWTPTANDPPMNVAGMTKMELDDSRPAGDVRGGAAARRDGPGCVGAAALAGALHRGRSGYQRLPSGHAADRAAVVRHRARGLGGAAPRDRRRGPARRSCRPSRSSGCVSGRGPWRPDRSRDDVTNRADACLARGRECHRDDRDSGDTALGPQEPPRRARRPPRRVAAVLPRDDGHGGRLDRQRQALRLHCKSRTNGSSSSSRTRSPTRARPGSSTSRSSRGFGATRRAS